MIVAHGLSGADYQARQDGAGDPVLEQLIREDQDASVRRSALTIIPVNIVLGLACMIVSSRYGHATEGLVWFSVSTAVNLSRIAVCRMRSPGRLEGSAATSAVGLATARSIDRHLQLSWIAALLSGCVWAFLPMLCEGYTSPQTLFYLTVVCGITAGAVTHGTAYARAPICFIVPALLSVVGCLLYAGGFDRNCLAGTVLLYLAALVRSARRSEAGFRETSRLKNVATQSARSLEEAHARSTDVAEQMGHRAVHDALTGLLNRAGFLQEADRRLAVAHSPHCLLLLDLDNFKSINDVFGHKAGDRVLSEVASRLRRAVSREFAIARLGGDEFAIFYELGMSDEAPTQLAARLIDTIAIPFESFDAGRLGVSIGVHQARQCDVADMLICADEALYAAKSAGRNRYRVFDDTLRSRLDMRRDVERDLMRAMSEGSLQVWFQPIFGQGGRALTSVEALVRWQHPTHGWIPPSDLISAAAMAGLSEPLLIFIAHQVCLMIQTLRRLGLDQVWVAMNVSPREMSRIPVDEILLAKLDALDLPRTALEVEITEETTMDIAAVQDRLANLSRAGVRLAIDDFGVGYSSLASLRHLHVDRVKVDRCFVTGISNSIDDQVLVQAILSLGRAMKFDVVAEGVETIDDLLTLRAIGCQFMQGFHLGRPMPRNDLLDLLRPLHSSAA